MITENETITETVVYLLLYDGHRTHLVPRQFYEDVRKRVLVFLPQMVPEQAYKSEAMCGADFWQPLIDKQQRMAGRCIAHMERNGLLPIRRLGCRHQYPARYALQ
jgi:hypothetical protein